MFKQIAIALVVLSATPAHAAPRTPIGADFDSFVQSTLRAWDVPGVSIAVVKDGKAVLVKGYGVRDPESGAPMTPDTRFSVASTTKAFTSFGVGLLVDEGKLSFDTPVRAYLPAFTMHDPVATQQVTLRDMMSHRTGLPRHDSLWYRNDRLKRAEILTALPHLESSAPLRTRYQYNNLMFSLSGHAVEVVAGQPWESFTADRIFKPLEMTRTTFDAATVDADPDHAVGTVVTRGKRISLPMYRNAEALGPAGGIFSTARDFSHWLSVHTSGGTYNGRRLIQPATLATMYAVQTPLGATPDHPEVLPIGYGLGWTNLVYRGQSLVQHGGNLPGISTLVTIAPEQNLGIAVMTNSGGSELPQALTRALLDRYRGLSAIDWTGDALKRKKAREAGELSTRAGKEATRVKDAPASHPLRQYEGKYVSPGYGELLLTADGERLTAKYLDDTTSLAHWHYDVFDAATNDPGNLWRDRRMQFHMDPRGRIHAVAVSMEPQVAPVLFRKQPSRELSDPVALGRLAGRYELNGTPVMVQVAGTRLQYTARGGQPLELIPSLDGEFTHPIRTDASIRFVRDGARPATAFEIIDATGVAVARRIE